ncbi:MAG: choloylglycine hydrolase family protein, partial [Anaerotignum sp.]|nr:choloylglycine hydrolase family protein [Anaerotignum sp.]
MCTAVYYKNRYFGRNLDYEYSFGEEVVPMPRGFSYPLGAGEMQTKYAVIGMAHVEDGIPLYYDGMNEKGLAMAGLLFAGNGAYHPSVEGKDNIPSWAFLPWILGQCENLEEAEALLFRINLTDVPFSEKLPPSPLHWMIADRKRCLVVETMADGLHIYENKAGVLTNDPPFPFHLDNLNQYLNLSAKEPINRFSETLSLHPFSRGMGAIGLPGDWSSPSRFVRAAFVRENSIPPEGAEVSQFFHILSSVAMPRGCVQL